MTTAPMNCAAVAALPSRNSGIAVLSLVLVSEQVFIHMLDLAGGRIASLATATYEHTSSVKLLPQSLPVLARIFRKRTDRLSS